MTNQEDKDKLLKTIREKRRRIAFYLQDLEPRGSRLTSRSVVFGGIAGLLTTAQLAFGRGSSNVLQTIFPGQGSVSVWQILAVAATICSAIGAIAGAIYKQQEIALRLAKAQSAIVKLEGLETSLDLDLIGLKEANSRYTQHIAEIPFVPSEEMRKSSRNASSLDAVKAEISRPQSSDLIPRAFRCTGTASDVGSKVHLWLAVEVNGLIWPKEGQIVVDDSGSWTATVFEDGATDLFSLSIIAAEPRAHRRIEAWLNSGRKTGKYTELTALPGTRRVARVDGLRRAAPSIGPTESLDAVSGSLPSDRTS